MKRKAGAGINPALIQNEGSVGDVMPMCIFVICIAYVLVAFGNCVRLINTKSTVSQISREYILKMETKGYLDEADKNGLFEALSQSGLNNISIGRTDVNKVGYGNRIMLEIYGKTEDGYEISEYRTSTAKY